MWRPEAEKTLPSCHDVGLPLRAGLARLPTLPHIRDRGGCVNIITVHLAALFIDIAPSLDTTAPGLPRRQAAD